MSLVSYVSTAAPQNSIGVPAGDCCSPCSSHKYGGGERCDQMLKARIDIPVLLSFCRATVPSDAVVDNFRLLSPLSIFHISHVSVLARPHWTTVTATIFFWRADVGCS